MSTTPSRPPFVVTLNSRTRTNVTDDPGSCTLSMPANYTGIVAVKLKSWMLPTTIYNVTSANNTFNLLFSVTIGGLTSGTLVTSNMSLPVGQYSFSQFATALQAALNIAVAGYGTFVVTPNTLTFKYNLQLTPNSGTAAQFYISNNTLLGNAYWPSALMGLPATLNTAWSTSTNPNYYSSGTGSMIMPFAAQLGYPEVIYVQLTPLQQTAKFADSGSAIDQVPTHFLIPNRQSGGSLMYNSFDVYEDQIICFGGAAFNILGQFKATFYGPDARVLSFNGADWMLELEMHFKCPCKK